MSFGNNNDADQSVHQRKLVSNTDAYCRVILAAISATCKVSIFQLVSI